MRFIYGLCLAGCLCAQSPGGALTLEQAIAEALEKNLGLLAERSNIAIAEARVLTARLRPNPVVSVGGDHMDLLAGVYKIFVFERIK